MLFIDANQYLELYRTVSGRKLLAAIEEQRKYIFVTTQVVDEVHRNKVKVAASFLSDQLKKLEPNIAVPDDFLGVVRACVQLWRLWWSRKLVKVSKIEREDFRRRAHALLEQVSRSEDDVSKALAGVFSQAVAPNEGELERAKERKTRGNPPGTENWPSGRRTQLGADFEQIQSRAKTMGHHKGFRLRYQA
jgi:hypothetical protein